MGVRHTGPDFPTEHMCEWCQCFVHNHESRCEVGEPPGERHYHLPPLCCPDCPCESFYDAHPEERGKDEEGPVQYVPVETVE